MTGWVALTGASRGIGRATAFALAERGCSLALLGRQSAEHREVVRSLVERGARVESIDVDLEVNASVRRAAVQVLACCGAPLALINNAGTITRQAVEEVTTAAYERQLAVNLRAPLFLSQALLPAMREAKRGRIIHVGSIASTVGTSRASVYCASKWGLVGFMKALAEELSGSGLMTAAILPGSVDTNMLTGSGFPPRMTPLEVASTIIHFALDAPLAHNGAVVEMFGT